VLNINDDAVTIKAIENQIIERAWAEGWVKAHPPVTRTGKRIAVIGSGPRRTGRRRSAEQGGTLGHRLRAGRTESAGCSATGFPSSRWRSACSIGGSRSWRRKGVRFRTRAHIGVEIPSDELRREFDAIVLAAGRRSRATCRSRAAAFGASTSRWIT
jgi:glutamate synthase (NADPH/NADH) small chain